MSAPGRRGGGGGGESKSALEQQQMSKREETNFNRNLPPLRISVRKLSLSSPASPPSPFTCSPFSTPTSSAWDYTTSPSSSCSSTPFSYFMPTPCRGGAELFPEPLIPGLPDDLALACLLRLPLSSQASGRQVCRSWQKKLSSSDYFKARRCKHFAEPFLLILAYNRGTGKVQWQVFDPLSLLWRILPPMPCMERVCPPGFSCVADLEGGAVFICGGLRSDMDCPLDSVLRFELGKGRWMVMEPMSTPRSFFATGLIDGKIYATGGSSSRNSSMEAYDIMRDKWSLIPGMEGGMVGREAVVFDGKLYVTEGFAWPYLSWPKARVFDPKLGKWEDMSAGMRDGWTGLCVILEGKLFNVPPNRDMNNSRLMIFHPESDSWSTVAGPPIPPQLGNPLSVNTFLGKIVIVARSLHLAIGTLSYITDDDNNNNNNGKQVPFVDWQLVHAPAVFSDFVPSHSLVLFA